MKTTISEIMNQDYFESNEQDLFNIVKHGLNLLKQNHPSKSFIFNVMSEQLYMTYFSIINKNAL